MHASLRALLSGIVDYAGLFPPAKLPLEQAIRNYARYRQEPDSWMLGRFICPAARLLELAPFADLFAQRPLFSFSALGRGGNTAAEFLTGLKNDLQAIADFHRQYEDQAHVDVLEVKLPTLSAPDAEEQYKQLLWQALELYEIHGPMRIAPFYEISLEGDWRAQLQTVFRAIRETEDNPKICRRRTRPVGFKLRCGGLEAATFPSIAQVAGVITICHEQGIPLKCTAGLHHPLRRFDASVQTEMHGFLNVFGAAVLASARPWCEELGQQILSVQQPQAFHFDAESFRWRDLQVSVADIQTARQKAAISFGSCSFDEPREDLRSLGWLQ
jgi:hypothetical protein